MADSSDFTTPDLDALDAERTRRRVMWTTLLAKGAPENAAREAISETRVRPLNVSQGIFRDKKVTESVAPDGVTVSIVYVSGNYDDAFDQLGGQYHYPQTRRRGGHDQGEIDATKNARKYGLPIFVIRPSPHSRLRRSVHLAAVESWDDTRRIFTLRFIDSPDGAAELRIDPAFGRALIPARARNAIDTALAHRSHPLYKPAALRVMLDMLDAGTAHDDIDFDELSTRFDRLVAPLDSDAQGKAWQPFFHLSTQSQGPSALWELRSDGKTADFTDLKARRPKSRGALSARAGSARLLPPLAEVARSVEGRRQIRRILRLLAPELRQAPDARESSRQVPEEVRSQPDASPEPAPVSSRWPKSVLDQVIIALEGCAAVRQRDVRELVLDRLSSDLSARIARFTALRPDVTSIVQACARTPGGMVDLRNAVSWFEGNSRDLQAVDRALTRGPHLDMLASLFPSYENEQTRQLSLQLKRAQARKRRLQRRGEDASHAIAEVLRCKRALRAGGQLQAGDLLGEGRYLLLRPIGRGGFARVWEALDQQGSTRVAIKVLHANLSKDPIRRDRFFRGARIMSELSHPSIARVLLAHGEDDGYQYFAMELLTGGSLERAVMDGRISRSLAIPFALAIGQALALAHKKGYVHRDVKPANILLNTVQEPKLTDFDLVAAADTTGGTRTGAMGSFLYAAPELMERPQDATATADVYGLAMTLVFLYHGAKLPLSVMRTTNRFIEELACPQSVKPVLKRALDWDPTRRYADARELCIALESTQTR